MELLQLRYFQMVAKTGSITKAAQHFMIPQPAMSQTIRRLENDLGDIRLFDRRSNRLYLNDNGAAFLKYVDTALESLDNGITELRNKSQRISGPIRILAFENHRFILDCVSQFSNANPDVTFSVFHVDAKEEHQTYDLCIAPSIFYGDMHAYVPLIQEEIILNVNEQHRLAGREHVLLSECTEDSFITLPSYSSINMITYESCRKCGFEPHIAFICDDPYYVRKYVSANMGIALAPLVSWAGRFRTNTSILHVDEPQMTNTSYLLWDDRRSMSTAVAVFKDYVLQMAQVISGNLLSAEKR